MPVILDKESKAGQAYRDVVGRYLGEQIEHRFTQPERRGIFQRLLWRTA
jgi:septum site-determining protein MinD